MCFDFSLRQNGVGQSEDNYDPLKDGYILFTLSANQPKFTWLPT